MCHSLFLQVRSHPREGKPPVVDELLVASLKALPHVTVDTVDFQNLDIRAKVSCPWDPLSCSDKKLMNPFFSLPLTPTCGGVRFTSWGVPIFCWVSTALNFCTPSSCQSMLVGILLIPFKSCVSNHLSSTFLVAHVSKMTLEGVE